MPVVKLDRIVSFSSEDPAFPASNLLEAQLERKWRCKQAGEASASVVLQLDRAQRISGIDIGNEHSAFIEVLVARSGAGDAPFTTLLLASSFMTPFESRSSLSGSRVRMFKQADLVQPACQEKWDRVQLVCKQPFNKQVQYGVSFIRLHAAAEAASEEASLGKFSLRPASPDRISVGSLFSRRKELAEQPEQLKGAAAIRQASNSALGGKPVTKAPLRVRAPPAPEPNVESRPRNRDDILYTRGDEEPHAKIDKLVQGSRDLQEKKRRLEPEASTSRPKVRRRPPPRRKPFQKLLEGVVYTISGIQNPARAALRDKATAMGARYKPDWDPTCTHLICVFLNTPKYNQVKGRGKIANKEWFEDCYQQRKRLPWRRYALDTSERDEPDSEEEIEEECGAATPEDLDTDEEIERAINSRAVVEEKKEAKLVESPSEKTPEKKEAKVVESPSEKTPEKKEAKVVESPSEKTPEKKDQKSPSKELVEESAIYDAETDEEIFSLSPSQEAISQIFANKFFHLDSSISSEDKSKLEHIIRSHNGSILCIKSKMLDYIIADDGDFSGDAPCPVVMKDWVFECDDLKVLRPVEGFLCKR